MICGANRISHFIPTTLFAHSFCESTYGVLNCTARFHLAFLMWYCFSVCWAGISSNMHCILLSSDTRNFTRELVGIQAQGGVATAELECTYLILHSMSGSLHALELCCSSAGYISRNARAGVKLWPIYRGGHAASGTKLAVGNPCVI